MIVSDLNRLREKDPETWKRFDEEKLGRYEADDGLDEYIYQEDLVEPARLAWLQAVLQEACKPRGWSTRQEYIPGYRMPCTAYVSVGPQNGDLREGRADSPAEALLRAYLEAIG